MVGLVVFYLHTCLSIRFWLLLLQFGSILVYMVSIYHQWYLIWILFLWFISYLIQSQMFVFFCLRIKKTKNFYVYFSWWMLCWCL